MVYNTKENDNHEEVMRVIIYDYISTNLFILVKLESHLFNYVFYFMLNLITVVFAEKYSNVQHFYYLDACTGLILFMLFYVLRRQWDLKSRKLFSEKYKYEKLFQYSLDFINGLNGYHINFKNNNIIFMDNRFQDLYNGLDYKNSDKMNEIFCFNPIDVPRGCDASIKINDSKKKASVMNANYDYFKINDNSSLYNLNNLLNKNDIPINSNQNNNIFPNHLNIDIQHDNKVISKNDIITKNKENEIKFNFFLDSLTYFEGKKFNFLYDNLFNDNNISLFNENENNKIDDTINTLNVYMNPDFKIKYLKNFEANSDKNKNRERNDLIYKETDINIKKNENPLIIKPKINSDNINNIIYESANLNVVEESNLKDNNNLDNSSRKKSLLEELKYIQSSQTIIQEKFSHLGIYYLNEKNGSDCNNSENNKNSSEEEDKKLGSDYLSDKNTNQKTNNNRNTQKGKFFHKYFDVFLRRIRLIEQDDLICDIIFYDVTELVTTRLRIYEESIMKQKIFAKIANEFKTPLNSIIGIVNSLNFEFDNLKDNFNFLKKIQTSLLSLEKIPKIENVDYDQISFLIKEISIFDYKFLNVYRNNISIIGNLSNYLNILTNDIIQYKNNFSDFTISKNLISVKDLIIFCSEILEILLNCKSKIDRIKIYINLDEKINDMYIYTDEIRMKQILLSFISNSVKFTKFGFISIDCFILEKTDRIQISINDSGQGIKEEQKKLIFAESNIFNFESSGSLNDDNLNMLTKYNFENGSGLCISKSLAEKLDCNIGFHSELGKGSSFYLQVPFMLKSEDRNQSKFESFEPYKKKINFQQLKNLEMGHTKENINNIFDKNNNINNDKGDLINKKEEQSDIKIYKKVNEDSNDDDDSHFTKIIRDTEKIENFEASLRIGSSSNFLNEIQNLNPYDLVLSITNELENKVISHFIFILF